MKHANNGVLKSAKSLVISSKVTCMFIGYAKNFDKYLLVPHKSITFAVANKKYRGVEQLVARQAHNLEVTRTSRVSATATG